MTEYKHVLIVSPETAESINDGIIEQAGVAGVGLILSDEKGLTPLSENFNPQELERLGNVLPKGAAARKANGVLHKLEYRMKNASNERQPAQTIALPVQQTANQETGRLL